MSVSSAQSRYANRTINQYIGNLVYVVKPSGWGDGRGPDMHHSTLRKYILCRICHILVLGDIFSFESTP